MLLLFFGLAHATLLWGGDILGAYGVVTLLLAGAVLRLRDRLLPPLIGLSVLVAGVGGAALGSAAETPDSTRTGDPLEAAGLRLAEWAPSLLLQPLGLTAAVLAGVWAARRRVLEQPERHRMLLIRAGTAGPLLAVAGGAPLALLNSGAWADPPGWAGAAAGAVHGVSGFGGIGAAALIALALPGRPAPGRLATALAACGQRSLSCYLAQSVLFVALLAPYTLGLGDGTGVPAAMAIAAAVWALTVAWADLQRRRGRKGPAERLLRRLLHRTG